MFLLPRRYERCEAIQFLICFWDARSKDAAQSSKGVEGGPGWLAPPSGEQDRKQVSLGAWWRGYWA